MFVIVYVFSFCIFNVSADFTWLLHYALQNFDVTLSPRLSVFEMFITPELEYPQICVGVLDG